MNDILGNESLNSGTTCPLCGAVVDMVLANEIRRGHGIVKYCEGCQHGFLINNQIVDEKAYYAEEYRKEYSHNAEEASTNAREIFEVYKDYQSDRLKEITPELGLTKNLLEVGASSGQFLTHVRDLVHKVDAIELDKACCEFLKKELGISADSNFLRESVFADELYDVVCSFQVLEHVPDPVKFIRDLKKSAKEGGVIFVEVPNLHDPLLTVWDVDAYKKFFYHSAHLHYFTEYSLRQVAIDAGFDHEQIEISFTQDYNVLNHLHWVMTNGPQNDCHVGLSKVSLTGINEDISNWLTDKMRTLNAEYVAKLVSSKCTSNMMMKLHNGK